MKIQKENAQTCIREKYYLFLQAIFNIKQNFTTPASNGHYDLLEFPLCDLSIKEDKYENNKGN